MVSALRRILLTAWMPSTDGVVMRGRGAAEETIEISFIGDMATQQLRQVDGVA